MKEWIRTCQECGHKQKDKKPEDGSLKNIYTERGCKKCKSPALDFGKWVASEADSREATDG